MSETSGWCRTVLAFVTALVGVTGCGAPAPTPSAAVGRFEKFVFVRDDAGMLPAAQRRQAEEELREIAQGSGVFGVMVTAGENEMVDPPRIFRPIVGEVTALDGEALITICSAEECGPAASKAHTDGLDDAVAAVDADAVAPGEGRLNVNRALRAWVEYVAAVAAADR